MVKKEKFYSILFLASSVLFRMPCLGLICPPAGAVACFGASTALGAISVACAASGPVGWGLFGLCTLWGA